MNNTTSTENDSLNTPQLILTSLCFVFDLVGIISNIALIYIFKQKDLKVRFNCLMIFRAMFDLARLISFIVNAIMIIFEVPVVVVVFLDGVAYNCSAYTMITIALERYRIICKQK